MRKIILFIGIGVLVYGCGSDCGEYEQELADTKQELAEKDSILDMLGTSFRTIDSNIQVGKMIEMELLDGIRTGLPSVEIQEKIETLKFVLESNKSYIENLKTSLGANNAVSAQLFDIVSGLEGKVMSSNNRLAGLNHELGELSEEYRNVFYEYLNAEVERQNAEENLQSMQGTMSEMEAKMSDLKSQLNQVYVAIGTKSALIDRGIMERGGLLKQKDINENTDHSEFDAYQKDKLKELLLGSDKVKVITEHPQSSYHTEGSGKEAKLVIDDYEGFWSLSRILIIRVD